MSETRLFTSSVEASRFVIEHGSNVPLVENNISESSVPCVIKTNQNVFRRICRVCLASSFIERVYAIMRGIFTWMTASYKLSAISGIPIRNPTNIAVAREVFAVPYNKEPDVEAVNRIYREKKRGYLSRMRRASDEGNGFVVKLEQNGLQFLNTCYFTLMNRHPADFVD